MGKFLLKVFCLTLVILLENRPQEELRLQHVVGRLTLPFLIFPFFFPKGGLDFQVSIHFWSGQVGQKFHCECDGLDRVVRKVHCEQDGRLGGGEVGMCRGDEALRLGGREVGW